jgi:hypothetical protein
MTIDMKIFHPTYMCTIHVLHSSYVSLITFEIKQNNKDQVQLQEISPSPQAS